MLNVKSTNIFSEVGKFFKENDATNAMNAIMDMTNVLKLSEKRLFGSNSKCNCKLTQLQLLGLLLFSCFMIRNAYNYGTSSLCGLFRCKSDTFYRFLSRDTYDWRKIFATVSWQLWRKTQEKRTKEATDPVCLMVNDTDNPKRGVQSELIGKIFSHITHSIMLGFKALFLGITDGKSQVLIDFTLVGEEGKKKNYVLKQKQLDARFSKEHAEDSHTAKRFSDYETIGGLFKDAAMNSVELTITERIWNMILEIVREIAECFNIEDEQILDVLVNRSDKLSLFVEIYQLKQAS